MKELDLYEFLENLKERGVQLMAEGQNIKYFAPKGKLSQEDMTVIKENKRELLHILDEQNQNDGQFSLTNVQAAYLLGREGSYEYGKVACHIYMEISYPELEFDRVRAAWNCLIKTHDMLRVMFTKDKKQKILKDGINFHITYHDFKQYESINDIKTKLEMIRNKMGEQVFDAETGPLFEIQLTNLKKSSILHISMDFLVADWTSIVFLLSEFEKIYFHPDYVLIRPGNSFMSYIMAEETRKKSIKYEVDKKYWKERINTLPPAPLLPMNGKDNDINNHAKFRRYTLNLNKDVWDSIKTKAKEYRLTPSTVILTCYALVVGKWSENKHFCLNLTTLNRDEKYKDKNFVVGDFTETTILEVDITRTIPFWKQAQKMQAMVMSNMEHALFSGIEVIREMAKEKGYDNALMPIVFTSAIGSYENNNISPMMGTIVYGISQTPQVFIDCQVMDTQYGLVLNWDVRQGAVRSDVLDDMFGAMEALIGDISKSDSIWKQNEYPDIPQWQKELYFKVNDTKKRITPCLLYEDTFERYKKTPEKLALADFNRTITYKEFMVWSIALSEKLVNSGIRKGDRVAVYLPKSLEQVVAVFGILMAGAVYVPLDIDMPPERIRQIKLAAEFTKIITKTSLDLQIETIDLDEIDRVAHEDFVPVQVSPDDLAYIIFTSGSTGMPKGVTISHKSAWNTIKDINDRIDLTSDDAVFGVSRLCFDLSVYDIFGSLSCGALLVYPTQQDIVNPMHWIKLVDKYRISVWNSVPAIMELMVNSSVGMQEKISSLRTIMLSGDWIPVGLPDEIRIMAKGASVFSLGGATEAAIWSNIYKIERLDSEYNSIPYGKPLSNQQFKILDSEQKLVPVWVKGDLYIKGDGLSKGYILNDESNKRAFLTDSDGETMYKTGDKGMYHPDGNIEFLGREDSQVKIHGYRIELKEIEAAINKVEGIQKSLVGVNHEEKIIALATTMEITVRESAEINLINKKHSLELLDKNIVHEAVSMIDRVSACFMLKTYEKLNRRNLKLEYQWIIDRWKNYLNNLNRDLFSQYDNMTLNDCLSELKQSLSKIHNTESFATYLYNALSNLREICEGKAAPSDILYPNKTIDFVREFYSNNILFADLNIMASELVKEYCLEKDMEKVNIMEVGAGTGATTDCILPILSNTVYDYYFTDHMKSFINAAKQKYCNPNMHFLEYDINDDFRKSGILSNSMDIIIAPGVLENAKDIKSSIDYIIRMLKPDGLLIWIDPVKNLSWIMVSQIFMMESPADDIRKQKLFLGAEDWKELLNQYAVTNFLQYPSKEVVDKIGIALFSARVKQNKKYVAPGYIQNEIKKFLPSYMLPHVIEIVDNIPLTSNGKVNKEVFTQYKFKETNQENKNTKGQLLQYLYLNEIAEIWEELLGVKNISVDKDLYNYGADSLLVAQGVTKICKCAETWDEVSELKFDELLKCVLHSPQIINIAEFINRHKLKVEDNTVLKENIRDIWCNLLGITKLEDTDNLYDNGLDSLIMAQGIAKTIDTCKNANNEYDVEFDIVLKNLLSNPTLETLFSIILNSVNCQNSAVIRRGGNSWKLSESFRFELLQENAASKRIIIMFHSGIGCINEYRTFNERMCMDISDNMGMFRISDVKIYKNVDHRNYLLTLAKAYADEIAKLPYNEIVLAGHSFGGMLAYETAGFLQALGISIQRLCLIEAYPLGIRIEEPLIMEAMFQNAMEINLLKQGIKPLSYTQIAYLIAYFYHKHIIKPGDIYKNIENQWISETLRALRNMEKISKIKRFEFYTKQILGNTNSGLVDEMFMEFCYSSRALEYSPNNYVGDVLYYEARPLDFPDFVNEGITILENAVIGNFKRILLDGDHFSIMKEQKNIQRILEMLK